MSAADVLDCAVWLIVFAVSLAAYARFVGRF